MSDCSLRCHICLVQVPRMEMHKHSREHALDLRHNAQPVLNPWITGRYLEQPARSQAPACVSQDARWLRLDQDFAKYATIDGQPRSGFPQPCLHEERAKQFRDQAKQRIAELVCSFEGLVERDKETCLRYIRRTVVFPGLVAYTFTHLKLCASGIFNRNSPLLFGLDGIVGFQALLGETDSILNAPMYLSRLNDILAKTNLESKAHKCNKHLISGSTLLRDDIQHFAATVALSLTGEGLHRISTIQGPEAESLVELLNAVIESLDTRDVLEDWFRRCLLNALIKITKNCGYYPADLALPAGSVIELELKKRGGFGCVYKGSYRNRIVAVKELRQEHSESSAKIQRDFCNEAIVWRYLRHPNCVPFYGVYSDETKMHLVSPWMHHGTLNEYLDKNPNANRMSLILDVIRGLHYLHSLQPHVAHRDLKPENILISNKGRACLADFGLATTFDTQAYLKSATIQCTIGGTLPYMAPELHGADTPQHKREINKRACDIYALGCTIYTVYAGKQPFAGISPSFIPVQVMNGARPNFNGVNIPPAMRSLAEKLWVQPPLERLTSQKALAWMESEAARNGLDTCCPPLEAEWKWEVATGKSKANGLLHLNVD